MSTRESEGSTQPAQSPESTQAVDPAGNGWREAWPFVVGLVREVGRQPVSMLAKQAAYSLLYAIPSILIVLASVTSIVDKQTNARTSEELQDFIEDRVPEELQPLLTTLVDSAITETSQGTAAITALVSLGVAIWGGAGGVGALIYACNLVYDVRDRRSYVRRTLLKLGLLIVGVVGIVFAFVVFAFGQRIGEWIERRTDRADLLVGLLTSGRGWPLALVAASLLLLYILAPDVEKSIRWVLPGTAAATLAVAIMFAGLDLILKISNPGSAYGAASSVLILLWSLWLMSAIVVTGAVVNAVVGRRFDQTLVRHLNARVDPRDSASVGTASQRWLRPRSWLRRFRRRPSEGEKA
jgi:membrane protein